MRTLLVFTVMLVAGRASGQDFYSPAKFRGDARTAVVPAGDVRCWTVDVATARDYTFTVSGDRHRCAPIEASLVLYPPDALDMSVWMANVDNHEDGRCVTVERRLTPGTYTLCTTSLFTAPATLTVSMQRHAAPPPPSNDTCHHPTMLLGAAGLLRRETLLSATHDYSPLPRGVCAVATGSKGPDRTWAIDVQRGQRLTVSLRVRAGNPTLYFLDDCQRWWLACVAASARADGTPETASWKNPGPGSKRIFVVVDTARQESATFDLSWRLEGAP